MSGNKNDWKEILIEAVIVIAVLFCFAWPVTISGSSMEHTLNDDDKVIISRFMGKINMFDKGDIIVFGMQDGDKKLHIIKRVIAEGGDHIEIYDGVVCVNGEILQENYAEGYTDGHIDIVVPDGEMFVMGDNRKTSRDSRLFGTIKKSDVIGKMILRFYPLDEITFV